MVAKTPLSVVVITKNEASRLADCLNSVSWAAEVIVMDDESTDGTPDLARSMGAVVVSRKMDIEGKHRNVAYGLATQPWILSLDADERVSPELKEEIIATLAKEPTCNGYAIPRRNFMGNVWVRHGGMYPSAQLRLFKKGVFRYDEQAEVHPQAYMQDPRGMLKSDVLHYTYRDFTDAIAKLDRQTDLEAKKWFRENRKVGAFSIMRKTIDRFWKAYFSKQGHKDGVIGLFLAVNSGMYQFLTYAKYWELKRNTIPSGAVAEKRA